MKKTVTTADYFCMFFAMLAWACVCRGFGLLAFLAICASIFCVGISFGSLAYDAYHGFKKSEGGGEQ